MVQYKVDFGEIPWESTIEHARSKTCRLNGRQIRIVEFARDFVEPDWCTKGHIGYVLEGDMDIDFQGVVVRYHQGDGLSIPAGTKHIARVLSDVVTLVMVEEVE